MKAFDKKELTVIREVEHIEHCIRGRSGKVKLSDQGKRF